MIYICVHKKHIPFSCVLSFTKTTAFVVFSFKRLLSTAAYISLADSLLSPVNQNKKIIQFNFRRELKRKKYNG